ncbi:MAG: DNA sulfur modification protein DndD [Clostridiales bacterium]|nr:DNA sulfur modification protein DndD [Clostridiales bacterium]
MIINTIKLKNFRSYEDETTFSFTPNNDKNIILIGGENGAGKSTLFEAIKLCIYGPITYGYLGENYNYLNKIRNNINNNAFKNEDVDAYIELNISLTEGTEVKKYTLRRSWSYTNKKLNELFDIFLNGTKLNEEEKLYFDKYIKSVLPPSLFDFFFFDGEELSDFFTGRNANSNLRESILELFNYDTFDLLKRQLLSYQRAKSKSNIQLQDAEDKYTSLSSAVKNIKTEINNLEEELNNYNLELEDLLIKRNKLEENFKNSGGLLEDEKVALNSKIYRLENERTNINQEIKDFCNNVLPFLLVEDLLEKTQIQIRKEETLDAYNSISNSLSAEVIEKSLSSFMLKDLGENDFKIISNNILNNMFDTKELNSINSILELSKDQKDNINHIISFILNNSLNLRKSIFSKFNTIDEIRTEIKSLREKLNSSISEDLLNNYLENLHKINEEVNLIQNNISSRMIILESKHEELKNKEYHLKRAKNEYTDLLQNNNTLDLSISLISYLNELIQTLTKDKIRLIEKSFMDIFTKIIRKDNYVNNIIIDDNFNTTLYINKEYNTTEILNLINNLGIDGIVKKYGSKFLEDLLKYYNVEHSKDLISELANDISFNYINLSTKININDFSNGEKQIYILCLIWAITKSSGVDIPFIIDTPYARIDETHRNSLTNIYLPNISKQVVILSTNKEIDSELYKVVKPYIANEYLLMYNTELRKTEVKKGYFEV